MRGTIKQFKVKGLSSCSVLNLRMSGEKPRKYGQYSIKTRKTTLLQLLLMIPYGDEGNLKRQIKNQTF